MKLNGSTGYYTYKGIMALQAYNIMKKRKTQFRVSEQLQKQCMYQQSKVQRLAGAWQSLSRPFFFLSFTYLLEQVAEM